MIKNLYFCCCCFLLPLFLTAQVDPVANMGNVEFEIYQAKMTGAQFNQASIFKAAKESDVSSFQNRNTSLIGATLFDFSAPEISSTAFRSEFLTLEIPLASRNTPLLVDLIKVEIHAEDFISNVNYKPGLHYRGVVRGEQKSLVSISVFENEAIGFVSLPNEILTLGKVKNEQNLHILYDEYKQGWAIEKTCNTKDLDISYDVEALPHFDAARSPGDCIRQKFEVDESLTNELGGVTQATNYATGVFNNQKTMYDNDGAPVILSELKIWSNQDPAPYVLAQYETLDSYRALTGEYNGDVAYLGFYQGGWNGGVASAIGGICRQNVDDTKAIGGHLGFYSDVPTYSHDVEIIAHEVGHLFGARHTHACVWNGNNTAIDGCAGFTEGGCSVPSVPALGTIMSYCGTNDFSEGFHPQVAQAIQNYIASRTCTSPCGNTPTCTDGIQNGDETGVDCGGSVCPPCETPPTCSDGIQNGEETGVDCGGSVCPPCETPPTCTDGIQNGDEAGVDCGGSICPPCEVTCNNVILTINFDNYPMETSWDIVDASGAVIADGGNYTKDAQGSSITINECLLDGCYTLNIYDSYGDGMCCAYGEGSYSLVDSDGMTLASGGDFPSIESSEFCFESTPTPVDYCDATGENTSYEYIARVVVGNIDNISGDDNGYGDYTNISTNLAAGSTVNVALTPGYPGNNWPEFWKVWIDYNQDGQFDEQSELLASGSGVNEVSGAVSVPASALAGATRMRVAMRYGVEPAACGAFDFGEVEDYTVIIQSGNNSPNTNFVGEQNNAIGGEKFDNGLNIYPNPGADFVNLTYLSRVEGTISIEIFDNSSKRLVQTIQQEVNEGRNSLDLNTEQLRTGVYFIRIRGFRQVSTDKLTIINE